MGKRLQARFSDINQHIIKKFKRNRKQDKKNVALKRKSAGNLQEPLQKKCKLDNINQENWYLQQQEISKEIVCLEKLDNLNNIVLKTKEHVSYDIFFTDELKNNYSTFTSKDFYNRIIDEIALEGLDGITIEAFWKRFLIVLEGTLHVDKIIQNFIWQNVILKQNCFQFFELPIARRELDIYDPFDYMHTDIGVVMEVPYQLPDIYPVEPVHDQFILGSCSTFKERVNISSMMHDLTITEAEEKYGQNLVFVGDQDLRMYALCGELVDPCIEFLNMEYCILERIGRSRKLGELTQGKMSLSSAFKMDAKTVFHYKKHLYQNDLISKQFFLIKSAIMDHNKSGSLLQLRRFYTNIRSRQSCIADQIINVLRSQPNYRLDSKTLRHIFAENITSVSKLLKNPEFKKFVNRKEYPYRTFFPNATPLEYLAKNGKSEKLLLGYELINPFVNIAAYWKATEKDESDVEDEKEEELSGKKMYKVDTLRDIYFHIYSTGDKGCSGQDIRRKIGLDINTTRIALNKLLGKAIIDFSKFDDGKQRKYLYKAKCWRNTEDNASGSTKGSSSTSKVKLSSIKTKMLERQKIALAKKKQESKNNPKDDTSVTVKDQYLKIELPKASSWKFLVKEASTPEYLNILLSLFQMNLNRRYAINLTYNVLNGEDAFNINTILEEIKPCLRMSDVKLNFKLFFSKKFDYDRETKCMLLKALLEGTKVNQEFLDVKVEKEKNERIPDLNQKTKMTTLQSKLNYMGTAPFVIFQEEERGVKVEILASTPPIQFTLEKTYPKDKTQTERVFNRIQIILNLINEMLIVEELSTLNKLIIEKETLDGYDKKLDRKSLLRILKQLVENGYVKIFKLIITNNSISKTTVFICHPSIEYTHDTITSRCEQLKWKHFFSGCNKQIQPDIPAIQKKIEDKFAASPFTQTDVLNSISEMKQLRTTMIKEIKRKFNNQIGKVYGVKPKFTRMRILHEFLFFLIYECSGLESPLSSAEVNKLVTSCQLVLTEIDIIELPKVYRNEISWKMFIPPLPIHNGWPEGWSLMCDIILRLPICVLLKVHNCAYEDPELLEILNHPIKRFYLVKDFPDKIRRTVLFRRKYLFDVYDTINRLVFCGLVQFGPHKFKEKDQVFIYLNRRASILNTMSSAPGYNEIEKKEYPKLSFFFQTHSDVESYWQHLSTISLNTKLNTREPGKLVTLVYINSKPELTECVKLRDPEEAKLNDNGHIPGDGKGAGGLDSALWSHLVRNWFQTDGGAGNSLYNELKQDKLREIPTQLVSFRELRLNSTKFYLAGSSKEKMKNLKVKKKISVLKRKKNETIKRTIQKRKAKEKKREYSDAIDRNILKKRAGRRSKWLKSEEDIIYLCKAVDIFLSHDKVYRKQLVPFTVVRDVIHRISPESKCKTSRAIQRRWNRLQKKPCYRGIEEHVSNLLKIKCIKDTFGILKNKIGTRDEKTGRVFRLSEQQMSIAFIILTSYVLRNSKKVLDTLLGNLVNNDHLSEDNIQYTEENLVEKEKKIRKYEDAINQEDIRKDVVKAIIHSSLCSKDGPINLTTQLLKIYQSYTDTQLREAVKELRETNAITCRKWKDRKSKIWDTPFALSQYYIFYQYSTFSCTTALESFNTFLSIVKERGKNFKSNEEVVQNKRYGQLLGLNEFFTLFDVIDFEFNLPQNTVKLNPDIQDHGQLVHELAVRYQLKLKALQNDNNETELDLEEDIFRTKNGQELEDDKHTPELIALPTAASQDIQSNHLDLTVDTGNNDTIDRLKTWIIDRVQTDIERRSPSPDFISQQIESIREDESSVTTKEKTERINSNNEKPSGQIPTLEEIKAGEMHVIYFNFDEPSVTTNEEIAEEKTEGINSNNEKPSGQIPTLEEIKAEMLKVNVNNEERTVPYITELSDLLKENFNELKNDTDVINLKKHFITEYTTLHKINIDDSENLQDHYMLKYIDDLLRNELMWDKIEKEIFVNDCLTKPNFEEFILRDGGNEEDIKLASDIIDFASSKTFYGATGQEIKTNFLHREGNCSLSSIIKNLLKSEILIQTGICTLTFVHYTYQYLWVVQQLSFESDSNIKEESIQRQKSMRIMPWVRVNGTLNKATLKIWISNFLSYCLDYPKVKFSRLCDKFCYIKPVDLYFIAQILEGLGCIELFIYEQEEEHLFSEWKLPFERYATILDSLEDIIIQPHNISMVCLGSFFNQIPE